MVSLVALRLVILDNQETIGHSGYKKYQQERWYFARLSSEVGSGSHGVHQRNAGEIVAHDVLPFVDGG
jgi:hypothetical protein